MRGRLLGLVLGVATLAVGWLTPSRASAWYFPEHVVLMGDGHATLAPEVRSIIRDAVAAARAEGFKLCEGTERTLDDVLLTSPLVTSMVRTPASAPCIPYAALPGLAGDHASDVDELRTVLTGGKGIELISVVAYEWHRFRANALRSQTSLDRMSYVHDLDVALYFIDSGYVTRARATRVHFRDVGRSFDRVLEELAREGRIDDLLGRFVFHHVRSLILAANGKRTDALLEHAFAIHFLEDAFAAGHLVMSDASWSEGRDAVRLRHDAFNAEGLEVTREMSHEPCSTLASDSLELAGLPPCWTTSGDGYLGLTPDATDRLHAAAALSRAELAFAVALAPERFEAYASGLGERELVSLGAKLDPSPWWTADPNVRRTLPAGPRYARRLVRTAVASVGKLRDFAVPPSAGVDIARIAGAVDPRIVASLRGPTHIDSDGDDAADTDANPGNALVKPTLAQLPTAQSDTATQHPPGHLDHGWAVQVFVATGATMIVPPSSPLDFIAPGVGASAGLSYRWGSLLPGRRARSIAELNVGISQSLHVDSKGATGGRGYVTMLDQELRWPVVWEALTTYTLPLDLARMHRAGRTLVFNGVRAHEVLTGGTVSFLGLELEALAIALSDGHGSHPLYAVSPEVRFYLGAANPSAVQPSFPNQLGFTFGVTLTGGYATFL